MALPDGLYDLLLTEGLARSLAAIGSNSADSSAARAQRLNSRTTSSRGDSS